MNLLDHLIMIVLVAGLPLYSARSLPGVKARIKAGEPGARRHMYWETCRMQWVLTAVVLGGWWYAARPWAQLGFSIQLTLQFWIVLAIAVAISAAMAAQYVIALRTPEGRQLCRASFGEAAFIMPHNRGEMRSCMVLAVTAGVCEEMFYRGFLIWYVTQFTGTTAVGLAAAVIISSIAFGVGHLYQGKAAALKPTGFALLAGTFYVVSGSLWIVMALHVFVDVACAVMAVSLLQDDDSTLTHSRGAASTGG
jgi:membrane protease YdiL (CAAX protease family)